jgi:hypothetical protein
MRLLIIATVAFSLASCGTTGPDQTSQYSLVGATGLDLCYGYISNRGDARYQRLVAEEIQKWGIDCREHLPMIQTKLAADRVNLEAQRQRIEQLNLARQLLAPSRPDRSRQGAAFLKREYTSGFNKICIYGRLGSDVAVTIGGTELCPLTLK